MKYLRFLAALILSTSISAEEWDPSDQISEILIPPDPGSPLTLEFASNYFDQANIEKKGFRHTHVTYAEFEANLCGVFYYNPCYNEGASLCVGYEDTLIDWVCNPYFNQDRFHTVSLALGGKTRRLSNWLWQANAIINMDVDHFNLSQYATYDFLLWGRYDYSVCPEIGLHIGLIAQTGMKIDHVYPIIGFDWQVQRRWKINAVFPVNVSAIYSIDNSWSVAVGGRFIDTRHRVGKREPIPQGILEYRTAGIELAVNYDSSSWMSANAHIGTTIGGRLKVSNQHHDDIRRYPFEPSPYFGGELVLKY